MQPLSTFLERLHNAHLLQQLRRQRSVHGSRLLLGQPDGGIEQRGHCCSAPPRQGVGHERRPCRLRILQQLPRRRVQRVGQSLLLRRRERLQAALLGHRGREGGAQQRCCRFRCRLVLRQRAQHQALAIGDGQRGVGVSKEAAN